MLYVFLCFLLCCLSIIAVRYINKYSEYEYKLEPIENQTYVIYYNTYSNVPANNYEVVIFSSNGVLHTLKGEIHVNFVDNNYHAKVKDYENIVNASEVWLYIPKNSLSYRDNINIGR